MKARRWAPIVFGVAIFLAVIAAGAIVFSVVWVRDHLSVEAATEASADEAFEEVRRRFADKPPLIAMRDVSTAQRHPPPADAPRTSLTTMHVLAWDPDEERLARFDLPFWFFRLKETPIQFGTYASGLDHLNVTLTAAEIERYGPGIVVDFSRTGRERALLWVD